MGSAAHDERRSRGSKQPETPLSVLLLRFPPPVALAGRAVEKQISLVAHRILIDFLLSIAREEMELPQPLCTEGPTAGGLAVRFVARVNKAHES